jgi:hypothetical protein
MIKYVKKVTYEKNTYLIESEEIEKKSFYTLEDAKNYLQDTKLKYYHNKNNISCYEEAYFIYKNNNDYKKYYKIIDYQGKIYTNLGSD